MLSAFPGPVTVAVLLLLLLVADGLGLRGESSWAAVAGAARPKRPAGFRFNQKKRHTTLDTYSSKAHGSVV